VQLHTVVVAGLPEEADFGFKEGFLPCLIVLHQIRQQRFHQRISRMHPMHGPDSVAEPAAITARLRAGSPEPIAGIVPRITRIAEPAHFVKLMTCRATDGSVLA